MPKYEVIIEETFSETYVFEIEAADEEQAQEEAMKRARAGSSFQSSTLTVIDSGEIIQDEQLTRAWNDAFVRRAGPGEPNDADLPSQL